MEEDKKKEKRVGGRSVEGPKSKVKVVCVLWEGVQAFSGVWCIKLGSAPLNHINQDGRSVVCLINLGFGNMGGVDCI